MNRGLVWGVGAAVVWTLWSCNNEPTKPLEGAGLRFVFPAGTDTLESLRVGLLDPDQTYELPDCDEPPQKPGSSSLPQTLGDCDSVEFWVTNLIGEEIRRRSCPAPPETICDGNALTWDGTDEKGNVVPGGIYTIHLRCFQPDSVLDVSSGLYVPAGPENECDWPLWSRELASVPSLGEIEVAPFPVEIDLGDESAVDRIQFRNPYLVRVHASGMQPFEQQVTLVEGAYADVNISFIPLVNTSGTSTGIELRTEHP